MAKQKISNTIKTLRFMNGEMTQKALAEKVKVARQTIIAIEQAKYAPSLELAFSIAHIFNKPIDEVFTYHPDLSPKLKKIGD